MSEIKPYITIKSEVNGFSFYYYLHIHGGSGGFHRKNMGGEFDFILFYASPDEMEGLDKCERIWCKEKGIIYGEGSTIERAHSNFLKRVSQSRKNLKNGMK